MLIQESYKLIQLFLGGRGQKWSWLFSSWDPNLLYFRNEFMNWAEFLNVARGAIIFGDVLLSDLSYSLNAGGPLQLYVLLNSAFYMGSIS